MGKKNRAKNIPDVNPNVSMITNKTREALTQVVKEIIQKTVDDSSMLTIDEQWEEFLTIQALIEKARLLEKDIKFPSYDRSKEFENFLKWLKDAGVEMNGVKIENYGESGYGLKCTKKLQSGEVTLNIPLAVLMSEETASKSSLGSLIATDPLLSSMGNVCVAIHLLNELCNEKSYWLPYLKVLPSTFSTVLYFSPNEIQKLKGSPVFVEAMRHSKNIARQYGFLYNMCRTHPLSKKLFMKHYFSYDAYRWAVSCTMTRVNRLPSKDNFSQLSLIPAWDMSNHEFGEFSTCYDNEKNIFTCYAHRKFSANEQFHIYYGKRSNSDFFLHNGFVYKDNPDDYLRIKMGVSKNDPNFKLKSDFLLKNDLPYSGTFRIDRTSNPFPNALLVVVAVLCLQDKSEVDKLQMPMFMKDISSSAWRFLMMRLSLLLRAYGSPSQETSLTVAEQRVQDFFTEEKKILTGAIEYIQTKLTEMD